MLDQQLVKNLLFDYFECYLYCFRFWKRLPLKRGKEPPVTLTIKFSCGRSYFYALVPSIHRGVQFNSLESVEIKNNKSTCRDQQQQQQINWCQGLVVVVLQNAMSSQRQRLKSWSDNLCHMSSCDISCEVKSNSPNRHISVSSTYPRPRQQVGHNFVFL